MHARHRCARSQWKSNQRRIPAREARAAGRNLSIDKRQRSHSSLACSIGSRQLARWARTNTCPGAGRLLSAVAHRRQSDRCARCKRLQTLEPRQHQWLLRSGFGNLRVRFNRSDIPARSRTRRNRPDSWQRNEIREGSDSAEAVEMHFRACVFLASG